uniref:probable 3-hydroxyisobutyrate dehydrogenase-like 1, mitochondrial n=1 Tax=Fragaria vesca subsp. vesca TaxID=101020 RepID=UPI0005C8C8C6|nr:PREDICTED: probable 3-hydroxyisobutyrate dehydrogenase-like 1, mitochondrial [Fragaria vesca subsp. vesca]
MMLDYIKSDIGYQSTFEYTNTDSVNADIHVQRFQITNQTQRSRSLDLYGGRILKSDFEPGFYVNHFVKDLGICLKECQNMGLALPGLALAQQLYLSLKAHGEGNLGTQALIVALEFLNNVSLDEQAGSTK